MLYEANERGKEESEGEREIERVGKKHERKRGDKIKRIFNSRDNKRLINR